MTLVVDQLSLQRNQRPLFREVSFHLSEGEALQLAGGNGAGKTSLLQCLLGLMPADEGSVRWHGQPISSCLPAYHGAIASIGHKLGIRAGLTAIENLNLTRALFPHQTTVDLEAVLAQLQLTDAANQPCAQLSAGQQQRLALGRLWLQSASLWILDEPFSALDSVGISCMSERLVTHIAQGGLAVFTTHQPIHLPEITLKKITLEGVLA